MPKKGNGDQGEGQQQPAGNGADDPAPGAGGDGGGNGGGLSEAEIRAQLASEFAPQLAELEALKKAQADAEKKRLEEQGEFQKLAEQREQEARDYQAKYERSLISQALLKASAGKLAKPEDAEAFLAGLGKVVEGKVQIDGKSPEDAVAQLLADRPYLAARHSQGGDAPAGGAPHGKKWDEMSSGELARLRKQNPAEYDRLKKQRGS